jgi:hypothetical protein
MIICEMNCMWQLDDEYSWCCIEPQNPIHVCEEIDSNRSSATRPTRELTFIKICRKLLDANLSEGRISPLDSLHLCQTHEQLGRWSWLKVERKNPSGTSRMVHSMRHNCGRLTFSVHPLRTLLGEILLQLDGLLTFLLSCCAFTPLKIGSL